MKEKTLPHLYLYIYIYILSLSGSKINNRGKVGQGRPCAVTGVYDSCKDKDTGDHLP